jgi:hypothetical protein
MKNISTYSCHCGALFSFEQPPGRARLLEALSAIDLESRRTLFAREKETYILAKGIKLGLEFALGKVNDIDKVCAWVSTLTPEQVDAIRVLVPDP